MAQARPAASGCPSTRSASSGCRPADEVPPCSRSTASDASAAGYGRSVRVVGREPQPRRDGQASAPLLPAQRRRRRGAPLRDSSQREHCPLLAEHFLAPLRTPGRATGFSTKAMRAIGGALRWPGNVRELRNAVERAIVLGNRDRVVRAQGLSAGSSRRPRRARAQLAADAAAQLARARSCPVAPPPHRHRRAALRELEKKVLRAAAAAAATAASNPRDEYVDALQEAQGLRHRELRCNDPAGSGHSSTSTRIDEVGNRIFRIHTPVDTIPSGSDLLAVPRS